MTYRARLEGTSETDSDSLISLIEDWVRGGGASVIVTGILMRIDPNCPVVISSLSELECFKPIPPVPTPSVHTLPVPIPPVSRNEPSLTQTLSPSMTPTKQTSAKDSDSDGPTFSSQNSASATGNIPAIIGGVVTATVFLIVLAILIIAIAALFLKNRRLTTKTAEMLVTNSLGVLSA